MSRIQIIILTTVTFWSLSMWGIVYMKVLSQPDFDVTLSEEFKQWEAQGRLSLINNVIDNPELIEARVNWIDYSNKLESFARMVMAIQNKAYGFDNLPLPSLHFIAMRGDANGLYLPQDQTIFINSKMQWNELPFERFISVILHENMHHIMSQGIHYLSNDKQSFYNDFMLLSHVAFMVHHMADSVSDNTRENNPQEWVAYRAQRAAKLAGVIESDLLSWDMSARMKEINIVHNEAGY